MRPVYSRLYLLSLTTNLPARNLTKSSLFIRISYDFSLPCYEFLEKEPDIPGFSALNHRGNRWRDYRTPAYVLDQANCSMSVCPARRPSKMPGSTPSAPSPTIATPGMLF